MSVQVPMPIIINAPLPAQSQYQYQQCYYRPQTQLQNQPHQPNQPLVLVSSVSAGSGQVLSPLVRQVPPMKKRSIVLFDCDDTLFPSSSMCYDKDAKAQPLETSAEELHAVGKSMYFVFRTYLRVFDAQNIFIVTNAKREWVMHSLDSTSKMFRLKDEKQSNEALPGFLPRAYGLPARARHLDYLGTGPPRQALPGASHAVESSCLFICSSSHRKSHGVVKGKF